MHGEDCLSAVPFALQPNDGKIEGGQEFGSVTRLERLWTSGDLPCRSKIGHQVVGRERHANRVFREAATRWRDDIRS